MLTLSCGWDLTAWSSTQFHFSNSKPLRYLYLGLSNTWIGPLTPLPFTVETEFFSLSHLLNFQKDIIRLSKASIAFQSLNQLHLILWKSSIVFFSLQVAFFFLNMLIFPSWKTWRALEFTTVRVIFSHFFSSFFLFPSSFSSLVFSPL
jgi:hypothetical protein